jgi:hypothetical protein
MAPAGQVDTDCAACGPGAGDPQNAPSVVAAAGGTTKTSKPPNYPARMNAAFEATTPVL